MVVVVVVAVVVFARGCTFASSVVASPVKPVALASSAPEEEVAHRRGGVHADVCALVQFGNRRVVFSSSAKPRSVSMRTFGGRPAIEPWRLPEVAPLFQVWLPVQ